MPPTAADIEEKWSQYPCTILEFAPPGSERIDLREPLGDPERHLLGRLGFTRPFAILTAENPWGENAEDEPTEAAEERRRRENAARRARLEDELTSRGIEFRRVDGVAPQGDYREGGVAIEVSREEAVDLARRYKQLALFWFDGMDFTLVGAVADKPDERLPVDVK